PPRNAPGDRGNAHIYYILLPSLDVRTEVTDTLHKHGIAAVFHYIPLHSAPAGLRFGRAAGSMRVTDDISARLLRLPLWPDMTADDVEFVVDALATALRVPA